MAEIKRVSYAWNSALSEAGQPGFFLDCLVAKDGQTIVDTHASYQSKEEFYEAVEGLIPLLSPDVEEE